MYKVRPMKDSGIEWIGEIPGDWRICRNKVVFSCNKEIVGEDSSNTQLLSLTTSGVKTKDINAVGGKLPESFDTYQYVSIDDIVMCLFDLDMSAVFSGISKYEGMISPAYKVLKCNNKYITPKYADYWFKFIFVDRKFTTYAKNLRYTLSYDEFGVLSIPIPSLSEQQKIAEFLDEKCSHIDSVLDKTKASIEEYKKLKQAVITQAVTKGIRPNRPMKDSGIEWIGEIPEDWRVNTVFQLFTQVKNKNEGLIEQNLLSLSYGKLKRKSIETVGGLLPESFDGYNIIEENDIVLRLTDLQNDHKSLRVGLANERGIITSAYVTIRNRTLNIPQYLYYYLHSFDIAKGFYGMGAGVRQGLNWDGLKWLKITIPNKAEQIEIVNYLNDKCAEIDKLIEKKEQLISELETYKKSLIYEYVTGKKEVV